MINISEREITMSHRGRIIHAMKPLFKKKYGEYLISNFSIRAKPGKPNVIISYLPFPFRLHSNSKEMRKHQNRREAIVIGEVFKEFGFNVDIVYYKKKAFLPRKSYDIVFGLEPNFVKFVERNPNAIKIYYATGAYWKYQNFAINFRTEQLNKQRNSALKPSRLVSSHKSVELADWIIQIGSTFTVQTYPSEYRKRIKLIRQSSFEFLDADLEQKNYVLARHNFLWFGGKGAILKGLDLLLEAFKIKQDCNLYVAGDIESDFKKEYSEELLRTKNIHFLGWLDIASDELEKIANSCAYTILPSASEGMPGSVVSMMRLGLIPIVSKVASCNRIEEFGFIIPELTVEKVLESINTVIQLDIDDIKTRSLKSQRFAKANFSLNIFRHDLEKALREIFNDNRLE